MGASYDRSGDSSSERPSSEISTRRFREQTQRDFEIDFLARVLDRDPFFVDAIRVLGNHLAAKGEYARVLQLDRRLVRLVPDNAIAWYNLACTYAVLGVIDPAFAALQRSLELGYRLLDRLRQDPDLKTLRRDPRFLRLLRRFEYLV
jgi:tetratricopeptide (TPR) repeat protein